MQCISLVIWPIMDDIEVIATTTTQYGGDLAISAGADEIIVGRLGAQEITDLLEVNKIDLLVDATHPSHLMPV